MDAMALVVDERRDLVDFLETLTADEWLAPTLCSKWRVRDVAAHVISYDIVSMPTTAAWFVRGRLSVDRINEIGVDLARDLPTAEIVEQIRGQLCPRGVTAGFGGKIALTDGLIHHQDIRRGLGRPRVIPEERLRVVLPFSLTAPTLPGRKLAKGVTVVATDLDWRSGTGPEVVGTSEALLMTFAGRSSVVSELTGSGVDILRSRLA